MPFRMNLLRKTTAEAIGTFALVFMGCGSLRVAEQFPGAFPPLSIPLIFGLAVMVMIYAVGHISGAHFNPVVTLAFAVARHFPKREVLLYWFAQFVGALAAVGVLSFILPQGAHYGMTLPAVPWPQAIAWEGILTFFLMFVIMAVATDTRAVGMMAGLAIGATVTLGASIGGPITGASMNPARSLAPAIFEGRLHQIWIYFIGPSIGAVLAALLYQWIRCEPIPSEIDEESLKNKKEAKGCC